MRDLIIGSHVFFARAGETIDGIVVGPEAKPDNDPVENFTKLACAELVQVTPGRGTEIRKRCASPGGYRLRKKLITGRDLQFKVSFQEIDELFFEELYLTQGAITQGQAFAPNTKGDDIEGWFKFQKYDQNNALISTLDLYCSSYIEPYEFGEKSDPYARNFEVLESSLNSGIINNL